MNQRIEGVYVLTYEKEQALSVIDQRKGEFTALSDFLWDNPEVGYKEIRASGKYCEFLKTEGFKVKQGLAGIQTAFSGTFGSGKPIIGILGEFDALPGMSQKAGVLTREAVIEGAPGHGCGHNLLGVASLAAAISIKEYIKQTGCSGTVIFYGCPAEENGAGKAFMARDGVFDQLDLAISWHPGETCGVSGERTMANYKILYKFYGISSHAAMAPERGRSALDAVELMNNGVQYLREHIPSDNRVHYAITNTGGDAPGIVQAYAEVLYLMRAPTLDGVKKLYERISRIAQGAALMTDTTYEEKFIKATSDVVLNTELMKVLYKNLMEVPELVFDELDRKCARNYRTTMHNPQSYFDELLADIEDTKEYDRIKHEIGMELHSVVMPFPKERQGFASSDVGDVSHVCPVGQIGVSTMPAGTAMHSWQEVAVGKLPMAHKGMLYAAKVMAGAGIDILINPEIAERAYREYVKKTGGKFISPIPSNVMPEI